MPFSAVLSDNVFHELAATRYLSAAGLMVLLYDHLLTFADEVELIWPAPPSYAKYIFLLNRYTVLGTLLAVAYELCGFVDTTFTDQFIFSCSMIAIVSIGIANLLILQRVVILWEHRPIVLKVMSLGFLVSFIGQVVSMIFFFINILPYITWSSLVGMCVATKSSSILIAVWASPMVFEIFVLASTALNALDRPRTAELPIIKALHSDGLGFFLSITCLRALNLTLATLSRPSLTFLAVFFIWAMTTTVIGRLLLYLRRAECPRALDWREEPVDSGLAACDRRAMSPFGLVPLSKHMSKGSMYSDAGSDSARPCSSGEDVTLPPIYAYHYDRRMYLPDARSWD